MAWIDVDGVIRRTVGPFNKVLGQPSNALVGAHIDTVVHPDDVTSVRRFLSRCAENARSLQPVEFRPKHHDQAWVSMSAVGGRRRGDVVGQGAVVKLVDISTRRNAENELKKSAELVRTLVDASPLAIVIENADGRVQLWNPAAERLFGWTAADVIGRSNPTVPTDSSQERQNLRTRVLQGQAFTGLESRRVTRAGSVISTSVTTAPLQHQDPEGAHLMEIVVDITEHQQLETQLRQAQKMEAIGRLAGGIAHDFNNLLTVITGYTSLLLDLPAFAAEARASAPEFQFDVGQIQQAAQRASALTHQLLAFSRAQVLQPTILDLNAAVDEMEPMLRRLIGEDVVLEFAPGTSVEPIKADSTQIAQVILNLALNARDAMPDGGHLILETSTADLDEIYGRSHMPVIPGRYVMLAVSDDGVGMDKETQARIFEPFFTTKEQGRGTGLGLATVYGIVRQSGGYIWVYSEPSHGTTFKVYLPSAAAQGSIAQDLIQRRLSAPVDGSETVLLVEDEDMVRALVRQVLSRRGYRVIEARNGEEALRLADEYRDPIDLMLSDLVMPGMSALDLARGFATLRPAAKILYMSGYTDHVAVRNSLLNSDHAFIQKPFAPERLAHRVREVLDQTVGGEPLATSALTANDLPRAARPVVH